MQRYALSLFCRYYHYDTYHMLYYILFLILQIEFRTAVKHVLYEVAARKKNIIVATKVNTHIVNVTFVAIKYQQNWVDGCYRINEMVKVHLKKILMHVPSICKTHNRSRKCTF